MAFTLSLDETTDALYVRLDGVLTDDVLLEGYWAIMAWVEANSPRILITDYSQVESFQITSEGVRALAAMPPVVPAQFLRVVIAPKDEIFGLARMFQMLSERSRPQVQIVRSLAEARRLLTTAARKLPSTEH
jgi:hypothetical protein